MTKKVEFEVCIDSLEGALAADRFGADRVELCSALYEGGLTPSIGLVEACVNQSNQEVFAMLRAEAGGFHYSKAMLEIMKTDCAAMANAGVKGVVFGVLNPKKEIDTESNLALLHVAKEHGLKVVFHRAFDFCPDPSKALQQLISMGFDRLLTSGQQAKAIDGKGLIQRLVEQSKGRIEIMAGSSVSASNAQELIDIGVDALHFSGTKVAEEIQLGMGVKYAVDEQKIASLLKFKK